MHRHLLGLTSPPPDFVADRLATTQSLPEDWDGDAWVRADGQAYFLRAWNAVNGRIAYGAGLTHAAARRDLLNEMMDGTRRVKISILESKPA